MPSGTVLIEDYSLQINVAAEANVLGMITYQF